MQKKTKPHEERKGVTTVTETEWLACTDPTPMLEFLRGITSERKLRLFAVACCRRVWHLLVDERSHEAVEVAERFADGAATDKELEDAKSNAWEFSLHIVHEDERFFDLDQNARDAADAPAWAAEWSVDYGCEYGECPLRVVVATQRALGTAEGNKQASLVRCIFGNPFRPVAVDAGWLTPGVVGLARTIYEGRAFNRMPELADALEQAGFANADILAHCREPGPHVRGCWVVDGLLGKE
jgi:hypothetical protein